MTRSLPGTPRHQRSFVWIEPSASTVALDPPSWKTPAASVPCGHPSWTRSPAPPSSKPAADGVAVGRATRVETVGVHVAADSCARPVVPRETQQRATVRVRPARWMPSVHRKRVFGSALPGLWHRSSVTTGGDPRLELLDPRDRAYAEELEGAGREVVVATVSRYRRPDRLAVGDPLPDLAAARLDDGRRVALGALADGRPLLLVFGSFT